MFPPLPDAPTELIPLVSYPQHGGKSFYSHDAQSSDFDYSSQGDDDDDTEGLVGSAGLNPSSRISPSDVMLEGGEAAGVGGLLSRRGSAPLRQQQQQQMLPQQQQLQRGLSLPQQQQQQGPGPGSGAGSTAAAAAAGGLSRGGSGVAVGASREHRPGGAVLS